VMDGATGRRFAVVTDLLVLDPDASSPEELLGRLLGALRLDAGALLVAEGDRLVVSASVGAPIGADVAARAAERRGPGVGGSVAAVPLLRHDHLVGVLQAVGGDERDVEVLELAAAWFVSALERAREKRSSRLLEEFSAAVNLSLGDLNRTLQLTVERVAE